MAEYKPQDAVLMSTTTTQYCLKDSTHTEAPTNDTDWKDLHGIQTLSDIGTTAPTVEQTTIEDTAKRYIADIKDGEDKELEMVRYANDENQQEVFTAANAGRMCFIRHVWPTGDIATYECVFKGAVMMSGSVSDLVKFKIQYKLNGDVTFSKKSA